MKRLYEFELTTPDDDNSNTQHALYSTGKTAVKNLKNRSTFCCWRLKWRLKLIARTSLLLIACLLAVIALLVLSVFRCKTSYDANNEYQPNQSQIDADHVTLGDGYQNLFWFLQITDTHFSSNRSRSRSEDLQKFCRELVPAVAPGVLLFTGDMTDAHVPDPLYMGSDQFQDEWDQYRASRSECMNAYPNMTWLDIRGNHDNLNVDGSYNAFYANYTFQGTETGNQSYHSYSHNVTGQDGLRYSFIGVDTCLVPGIKRPFNFVGHVYQNELQVVMRLKTESNGSNYTIWFGHYPLSTVSNPGELSKLINGPYLSGHYHNLYGLVPAMYTTQSTGFLDAELGDWKERRYYRIAAIDSGLFTFTDFNYKPNQPEQSPMIVITNPRSVLHQMENYEPYWRAANSTHIRALIFGQKTPIANVSACIYKEKASDCIEQLNLTHVSGSGPLWTVPWSASQKYPIGLYYITLTATNYESISSKHTVPFSFDGTKPSYTVGALLTMRISFQATFWTLYAFCILGVLSPLLIMRSYSGNSRTLIRQQLSKPNANCFRRFLVNLHLLANINQFFYPLISIPVYLTVGPWFVGKMVGDSIGVVFLWGIYVEQTLLPTGMTYLWVCLFLALLYFPYTILLSTFVGSCLRRSTRYYSDEKHYEPHPKRQLCCHYLILIILVILVLFEILITWTMINWAYGLMAAFVNIFPLFGILLLGLIYQSTRATIENVN